MSALKFLIELLFCSNCFLSYGLCLKMWVFLCYSQFLILKVIIWTDKVVGFQMGFFLIFITLQANILDTRLCK